MAEQGTDRMNIYQPEASNGLDPDKRRDCPFNAVIVSGVRIESRYGKQHELRLMAHVIDPLSPQHRSCIRRMLCDSKCGCAYSVTVQGWNGQISAAIDALENGIVELNDGHNGIRVEGFDGLSRDCNWNL
jgi:hypothetical protein